MSRTNKFIIAILVMALMVTTVILVIQINSYNSTTVTQEESQIVVHEEYASSSSSTSVAPTTTSTIAEAEGDQSATTTTVVDAPEWVNYPSSDKMIIDATGTDVTPVVTGPDRVNAVGKRNDPKTGTVDLWVSGDFVEPCELGMVLVTAHTNSNRSRNNGGVAYEWVDYQSVPDDGEGLQPADTIVFEAENAFKQYLCTYEILEWPAWTHDSEDDLMQPLGDTIALYFPKEALNEAFNEVYSKLRDELVLVPDGVPGLLVLSTSYGGPSGNEYKSDGVHKYYNAVLLARLVDIVEEDLSVIGIE